MFSFSNLFKKDRPSPSYPVLPVLNQRGETNIKGLFLAGEIAGKPLIKVALNEGVKTAEFILEDLKINSLSAEYDVIVIGAGASGIAAATKLKESGAEILVIDSGKPFQTLRNFTKGKLILAEPDNMDIRSSVPFEEGNVEEVLDTFDKTVSGLDFEIKEYTAVKDIKKENGTFRVVTERGDFTSLNVLLATGKAGNPRKAGVPGELENSEKISHFLKDPDDYNDKSILIYGGGDVAAEAALALCDNNKVTLATVDEEFIFPKKKNVDAMIEKEKEGKLDIKMSTKLLSVDRDSVSIGDMKGEKKEKIKNDFLFEMIGAEPPVAFFNKVGIKLENKWSFDKIIVFFIALSIVLPLYTWKKGFWPFSYAQGISHLPSIFKNPSFWYSALYTIIMAVFGLMAMKRWSRNWKDTYQIKRFASLIIFQMLSFFTIECILAVYLPPDTWWRAYAINNPFPLLFDSFNNLSGVSVGDLKWIIAAAGFLVTFVVIPIAVRYHGKRFCTWLCGCGGLAETLGDRWRHLSQKGERSRRWEFMGSVVLFWALVSVSVILFIYNGNTGNSGKWYRSYSFIVDFWLIAVIPTALYPIYGGKVWCRYWCPLAKYMEYLSRWYGKLKITSNDKCIQCTQCSLYCQVGVDVMAFAKNGESFSNKETSCIHCGICITVCPMDVLKFER